MDRFGNFTIGGGLALVGIVSKGGYQDSPVRVGTEPLRIINPATGQVTAAYAQVLNIGGIGVIEPISKALKLVQQYCSKPV